MWPLANDRSIVIKKADKGWCVVVWDHDNYIAEAEKQLSDKSVYRDVNFNSKILQNLAETSNSIFKNSKRKGKITGNKLKHFIINHKKLPTEERCICYPKFIKGYKMCWGDQLFPTVVHPQRKFLSSQIISLNPSCKKVCYPLKIQTIISIK